MYARVLACVGASTYVRGRGYLRAWARVLACVGAGTCVRGRGYLRAWARVLACVSGYVRVHCTCVCACTAIRASCVVLRCATLNRSRDILAMF